MSSSSLPLESSSPPNPPPEREPLDFETRPQDTIEATSPSSKIDPAAVEAQSKTNPLPKKRSREGLESADDPSSSKTLKSDHQNLKTMDSATATASSSATSELAAPISLTPDKIKGLRLEAIFHPKFDNEKREKQPGNPSSAASGGNIRSAIMERLSSKKGYLEVSLKHSGSLILWSGGQRYYSKNSCRNQFTQVAEILLRQHFVRAFWSLHSPEKSSTDHDWTEHKYQECSNYIERHRLTCAFEVVTAVLGDHGQIPARDFLILTAVADRQHERFYSTPQVLEFCQRFRLPHNDVWTFTTPESAQRLFALYDSSRETGKAEDTVRALNAASDAHVPSMYPHNVFQGDILEGFIIRYIPNVSDISNSNDAGTVMERLGRTATQILNAVPPEMPPSFELVPTMNMESETSKVLTTDVRKIYQSISGAAPNDQNQLFQQQLARVLDQTGNGNDLGSTQDKFRSDLIKMQNSDDRVHLPSLVKHLVDEDTTQDVETRRIAQLLQTLDSVKGVVQYSLFTMPTGDGAATFRTFCMVHVKHDTTFFKFQKQQIPGSMALFRGFCVELLAETPPNGEMEVNSEDLRAVKDKPIVESVDTEQPLMMKMKLLPYMVRTFICRNLLQVLEKDGPVEFCLRAESLMKKWGISEEATEKWAPFFSGWAQYVMDERAKAASAPNHDSESSTLGPLTNFSYLKHLEHFTQLYESGRVHSQKEGNKSLEAFVCVVAERIELSQAIATLLAERLNQAGSSSASAPSTGNIVVTSLQEAMKSSLTRSCIVYTSIGEKNKGSKAFFNSRKVLKHSIVVLYASESVCLSQDASDESSWFGGKTEGECKRISAVFEKLWKKQPCAKLIMLSRDSVQFESKDVDSGKAVISSTTPEVNDLATTILSVSNDLAAGEAEKQRDPSKRSILLLFPGIPGCGKSSIVRSMESNLQDIIHRTFGKEGKDRQIFVKEGDKIGKKFWDMTENVLSGENDPTPALFVADKNTPPTSWSRISQVLSDTRSIPQLVLPDSVSLETTTVEGAILPDGVFQAYHSHFYPFSLKYLAICLERVLSRSAGEHSGKLDCGLSNACTVVLKFYCFYRDMSADTLTDLFEAKLEQAGAEELNLLEPIKIPFLSSIGCAESLPKDLEELLVEGIQLRHGYDSVKKAEDDDNRVLEFETRLRECIEKHRPTIREMATDLDVSRSSLNAQLLERIATLNEIGQLNVRDQKKKESQSYKEIKLVSLDVDCSDVHKLMSKLDHSTKVKQFFGVALEDASTYTATNGSSDAVPQDFARIYSSPTFIPQTHVTMAFAGRKLSAKSLEAKFCDLQGAKVSLTATRFIWSKTHAALAVDVSSLTIDGKAEVPPCENVFPHITVWCASGSQAYHSNRLPALLESGEASEVDISPPVELVGTLTFWNQANQPFQI